LSNISISFFRAIDQPTAASAAVRNPAQCFGGASALPRVDAVSTTTWPAQPHATIGPAIRYAIVYLPAPALIFAGPAAADATAWQSVACAYPAGWWPIAVEADQIVAVKDL